MCDHLECHGNGLKIYRDYIIQHFPPDMEWPEGTVSDRAGWGVGPKEYFWIVEFRQSGPMFAAHDTWEEAMDWALKYLALEGGHGA